MKRFLKTKDQLTVLPVEVCNAEITNFRIVSGPALMVEMDFKIKSGGQGFQCVLGAWDEKVGDRTDNGFTYELLECILLTAGVSSTCDLVGRNLRIVRFERNGYIKGFGHIIRDEFFLVDDILKMMKGSVK